MPTKQVSLYNPPDRTFEKDTVGTPMNSGLIYDGGPWSLVEGEVMSEVVGGGSALMQWIPSRGTIGKYEHVKYLGWVAPDNLDGSATYMDFLAGLAPPGDCDFGPTSDWNGFEYRHDMYRISFKSETLTRRHMGERQFETQPIVRLRGSNAGMPMQNEGEWALARVAFQMVHHMDWNLIFGDPAAGPLMYHGLDNVIETGWVAARAVGNGQVTMADPEIVNAVGITDPAELVKRLRAKIRKIRLRAYQRGYRLTPNDYAVVMSGAHWNSLADHLAVMGTIQIDSRAMQVVSADAVMRERQRITSGGFGFGAIDVDGQPVNVLVDDLLASNVTMADGNPGVTGDIYVLTRYFAGQTILEHQYLDWNRLPLPEGFQANEFIRQNGMVRAGWVSEANSCFYYYADMWGRIISRFQPLQVKFKDVTLATLEDGENESISFASQDYYAYGGGKGGAGTAYLVGRK